jgi:hypothetical protein
MASISFEPSNLYPVQSQPMDDQPNPALLAALQNALDVMEECSHLGLDEEGAGKIRRILLRQIAEAESALPRQPAPAARRESRVFIDSSTHTHD